MGWMGIDPAPCSRLPAAESWLDGYKHMHEASL